jgi:ATP-dependent DNA helicase RecQ
VPSAHSSLDRALAEVFGFDGLRPGQREVIDDVLAGHPVITVMPTGAGKSLCYQLPAVLLRDQGAVTLVVSPLIALMKDQVDGLRARGVAAAALTSASAADEQRRILCGLSSGAYTVVYVAPERFRSPRFLDALAALGDRLGLFAIDEAHCISEWGHEFRPDYRRLGEAVLRLRPPRLVALTATATPAVRQDIGAQLHIAAPRMHVRGFDRPNLHYAVDASGGAADKARRIVERVRLRTGGAALVYAATRKNAERYAQELAGAGMRAGVYHAGLDDDARHAAQDRFMASELDVIVATNAFGMGVDKPDIRVVVHADLPRSAEAYYQESGRGGRDGERTDCVLLFNHGDVRLQEFLIDAAFPAAAVLRGMWKSLRAEPALGADLERLRGALPDSPHLSVVESAARILGRHGLVVDDGAVLRACQPRELPGEYPPLDVDALERRAEIERGKLRAMLDYAYHPRCRRQLMLEYFGDEDWRDRAQRCGACDNCKGQGSARELSADQREQVLGLLALVARLSGRFGRAKLAAVATGTDDDHRLEHLAERGALRGHSQRAVMDLLRAMEGSGLVESTRGDYPTIALARSGERVLSGAERLGGLAMLGAAPASRSKRRAPPARVDDAALDAALVDRLRALRSQLASEKSVPAYVIFSNRTLESIARHRPASLRELAGCHGIGPGKLDAYGEAILAAIGGEA